MVSIGCKQTYPCKHTRHVTSTSGFVSESNVTHKMAIHDQPGTVESSVDSCPAHHGGTEPAVQGDDLRVGETNGVEERTAEDQKEDDRGVQQDSLRAAVGDGADNSLVESVALDVVVLAVVGGDDEPVDVHDSDNAGEDPELDGAAKVTVMALPDGDPLLLAGWSGDLGDGALELARGAEVVAPDGDKVAEHDGQ